MKFINGDMHIHKKKNTERNLSFPTLKKEKGRSQNRNTEIKSSLVTCEV